MSSSVYTHIGIGFMVPIEDALRAFTEHVEEEAHMEDRFDPKTGKKQLPMKVIDHPAREVVRFGGEVCGEDGYYDELIEALAGVLNCIVSRHGYDEVEFLSFQPNFTHNDDGKDLGRVEIGGTVDIGQAQAAFADLERLAVALRKIGIEKLPKPTIFTAWNIC